MIFKNFMHSRLLIAALTMLAGTAYAQSAADLYDQMKAGRCALAFEELSTGARVGSPIHMKVLGDAHYFGNCTEENPEQAVDWYHKAAELGHASAQNNLGILYAFGEGLEQDNAQAVFWFEKSARQGDAWGQRNLATSLRDGKGLASNPVQAYAWFSLAASAEAPHPDAAKERDALVTTLSPAHVAEAKRLAREWKLGKPMGLSRLKPPVPVKTSAAQGPYPGQPAKRPGVTSCNTNCTNGDCYRTYDNGRKTHFQAKRRFNPFNSEWEYDSGSC